MKVITLCFDLSKGCDRSPISFNLFEFPEDNQVLTSFITYFLYERVLLEGAGSRCAAWSTYPGSVAHRGNPTRCKRARSDGRPHPLDPAGSGGL